MLHYSWNIFQWAKLEYCLLDLNNKLVLHYSIINKALLYGFLMLLICWGCLLRYWIVAMIPWCDLNLELLIHLGESLEKNCTYQKKKSLERYCISIKYESICIVPLSCQCALAWMTPPSLLRATRWRMRLWVEIHWVSV